MTDREWFLENLEQMRANADIVIANALRDCNFKLIAEYRDLIRRLDQKIVNAKREANE